MSRRPKYVTAVLKYYREGVALVSSILSNSSTYPTILMVVGAVIAVVIEVGGYIK